LGGETVGSHEVGVGYKKACEGIFQAREQVVMGIGCMNEVLGYLVAKRQIGLDFVFVFIQGSIEYSTKFTALFKSCKAQN